MPKRTRKTRLPDPNQLAFSILQTITGEVKPEHEKEKNQAAVELGRLGGLKGGKARAEKLSSAQLKKIAKKAAKARWSGSSYSDSPKRSSGGES